MNLRGQRDLSPQTPGRYSAVLQTRQHSQSDRGAGSEKAPQAVETVQSAPGNGGAAQTRVHPFAAARNASAVSRTPVSNGVGSAQNAVANLVAST